VPTTKFKQREKKTSRKDSKNAIGNFQKNCPKAVRRQKSSNPLKAFPAKREHSPLKVFLIELSFLEAFPSFHG